MWRALPLLLIAAPLFGDLRIVTKQTFGANTSSETDFYKGDFSRWDMQRLSYIVDKTHNQAFVLLPEERSYYTQSAVGYTLFAGKVSSVTLFVETETRETGETRQEWGHTAHRYITTRRQRTEGADGTNTPWEESTIDSWFLDVPVPANYRVRSAIFSNTVLVAGDQRPLFHVMRKGAKPQGILLYEKAERSEIKVTDLSEAPLDQNLFAPPPEYRRLIRPIPGQQLSWDEQIQYYWQQFEDWLTRLFS